MKILMAALMIVLWGNSYAQTQDDAEKLGHPFLQHGIDKYVQYVADKAGINIKDVGIPAKGTDLYDVIAVVEKVMNAYHDQLENQKYVFGKIDVAMLQDATLRNDIEKTAKILKNKRLQGKLPPKSE